MVPKFTTIHSAFKLNGEHYDSQRLKELAYGYTKEGESYQKQVGDFLLDWLDDSDTVIVQTSGSTGTPKKISLHKNAMVESALATGTYFNLNEGTSALHCLPTDFIAGKMMLVRALILGWHIDLRPPNSSPLLDIKKEYDFSAMVPLQLQNSIEGLKNIKTLIVGGAAVSIELLKQIQNINCKIYATYGMTETITHIAVKRLNGNMVTSNFELLPDIKITKDDRGCLVIAAPRLSKTPIVTNDLVELTSDNTFKLLGRIDNIINSGGVKLFPEQIERKLQEIIPNRFFVSSQKNEELGEQLVLIVEGDINIDDVAKSISQLDSLQKFEVPKQIYTIAHFAETNSGKVRRHKTRSLLKI